MNDVPELLWSTQPHAGYYINSVAVSDDGNVIVAGTFFHQYGGLSQIPGLEAVPVEQRKIFERIAPAATRSDVGDNQQGCFGTYAWDRAGNRLLTKEFDGWQGVYWVDVAADGGIVASCGWQSQSPYAGFVGAWAVPGGDELLSFALPVRGNMVALDACGRTLLAGAEQGYLFYREGDAAFSATPACIALTAGGTGDSADSVIATGIAADGTIGLVASAQGEIILFPIAAGQPGTLTRWQLPRQARVHAAALSGDGRRAYAGASDGTLYAFDVAAFQNTPGPAWTQTVPEGATTIYGVACDRAGNKVAIAGNLTGGGVVAVYADAGTAATLQWTAHSAHSPNDLAFDPDGQWLGLADGHPDGTPGAFTVWNAGDGTQQWSYGTDNMSWPIRLNSGATVVVGGSDDSTVTAFVGPGSAIGRGRAESDG
ncbi:MULTISPECIES: WD40 repeat domain-containing protein [Xanthomonas]|uniref:WD40 repeat domain-containing protein n=1 Tax=Xanthomonas TaxID=338 RepID=UPI001ADBE748|nr:MULTISPECIES: WD40 repeat domain-containing protein [unclassified Xanthomonas]MBO9872561.1 PQQ-binding-like beta-propeller repeat protein [Xanthomonas sp. D-93]WNH46195.1 WD40 repeat domain-containing protein [Xanthomonas sp. A6251]